VRSPWSLSNQRMKLTTCGGRLKRKNSILSAAATGCSLCAFRYADTNIDPQVSREHETLDGLFGAGVRAGSPGSAGVLSVPGGACRVVALPGTFARHNERLQPTAHGQGIIPFVYVHSSRRG